MTRTKKKVNKIGLSESSNLSYEQYLKAGFSLLSDNLTLRVYKLAPKNEYPFFERGKDVRVRFYWNEDRLYEIIVDKVFFQMHNRNKEDRSWMRTHADIHINNLKNSMVKKEKKNVA